MASSLTPTSKTTAAGATGAAAILIVWLLSQFGIEMPGEVGAAVGVLLAVVAAWIKAERRPVIEPGTGKRVADATE